MYNLIGAPGVRQASVILDKLDENFGKYSTSMSCSFVICSVGITITTFWEVVRTQ